MVGDLAAAAEVAGWDGFFIWDHLQYGDRVTAIADPWICCAAIAMRTERLLFGPMVTPLPRRRPQVLARQAASLAVLSGERFVLGLGLGDDRVKLRCRGDHVYRFLWRADDTGPLAIGVRDRWYSEHTGSLRVVLEHVEGYGKGRR